MRKSMQISSHFHMLHLQHHVPIPTPRRSRDNVLVECERNEEDQREQIYHRTHSAHRLRSRVISISSAHIPNPQSRTQNTERRGPYISGLFGLAISLPFSPAAMNTRPNHRIRQNAIAKAIPLNATDANNGAPSPRKLFTITPIHTPTSTSKRQLSWLESVSGTFIMSRALSTHRAPAIPSTHSSSGRPVASWRVC